MDRVAVSFGSVTCECDERRRRSRGRLVRRRIAVPHHSDSRIIINLNYASWFVVAAAAAAAAALAISCGFTLFIAASKDCV